MEIRIEALADAAAIARIVTDAFGQEDEAKLVSRLRAQKAMRYPLVACAGDDIQGFVVASPITLDPVAPSQAPRMDTLGIAPLAVDPSVQTRGIGSALMQRLIDMAKADGVDALFLLGNPGYYGRFSFTTSHIANEYGATDAFMHRELTAGVLTSISATARYHPAFAEAGL